ncbi:MAG: helix-turn-helix transcriptional regulator [Clostridia bacterium]
MAISFQAILIRRERFKRAWSQEGLCKGICAVSYLSKIEQGKAVASREMMELFMKRLDMAWQSQEEAQEAQKLAEQLYEAVFCMDIAQEHSLMEQFAKKREAYLNGPSMLDFLLFEQYEELSADAMLCEFENAFDERQRALWLQLNERYEELLRLEPSAWAYGCAGVMDYRKGCYSQAQERLARGYELAAAEGYVHVMLHCKLFLGNCYSDLDEYDMMLKQYQVAERLAEAIGDTQATRDLHYNRAATAMQLGKYKEAYAYFSRIAQPTAMHYHKLAICCEKLDKREEALAALNCAQTAPTDFPDREWVVQMCAVVSYRLLHPSYLGDECYGSMLLDCFKRMRKELPNGYATYHLPWVLEWYTANRQYKQAYELSNEFSNKYHEKSI